MSLNIVLSVSVLCAILVMANGEHNLTAFEAKVRKGTDLLLSKHIVGQDLQETLGVLNLKEVFFGKPNLEALDNSMLCIGCSILVSELINVRRDGMDREALAEAAKAFCTELHIQSEPLCQGFIDLNIDIIIYVVDTNTNLTGLQFCPIVFQLLGCEYEETVKPTWDIPIHEGESPKTKPGSGEALNILHMSDIHFDPLYQEGTLAKCDHPLCCQYDSGDVENIEDSAGYWAEYNHCDVSDYLLEDTFKHIAETHDLDYVYFTGDIISHRMWATDVENNTRDIKYVYSQFREYFGDVQVYPILGNHEPHPLDVYAPLDVNGSLSTKWVFELVADEWSHWLGDECRETILAGGYYTKLIKPGVRIIGLNSNVAYTFNWWLLFDDVDNFGQLAWLENVLYEAEQNGESVHILSHVPTGDSTAYSYWEAQLVKIILRYQNTITAIINGHTHYDEFITYYNDDGTPVRVVAYNGGSLTPWADLNPNYRILKVDSENFDLLDYDQYMFNITDANQNREKSPEWFKQYSFKEAYGVNNLLGEDISELLRRMATEPSKTLLRQYINFKYRDGPKSHEYCDEKCLKNNLEQLVIPFHGNTKESDKLMEIWQYDGQS